MVTVVKYDYMLLYRCVLTTVNICVFTPLQQFFIYITAFPEKVTSNTGPCILTLSISCNTNPPSPGHQKEKTIYTI